MNDKVRWGVPIFMGIVLILVIIVLQNSANDMLEKLEKLPDPESKVVVTIQDKRLHQLGCNRIQGQTDTLVYQDAVNRYYKPCPACFPQLNEE